MANQPKVSVITISYNHERYIRQALESIVTQQVNFNFEVIIADDKSTDTTADIISEYAAKYPNIVKPVLRDKNLGPQKNFKNAMLKAKGDYIALCEGDDYWTDTDKLQKQVDFLDDNIDYSMCFHPVEVVYENKERASSIFPEMRQKFTTSRLLESNFIQTNSVLYRRQEYANIPTDILPLDWYLHLYHAKFGKIGFIDKTMSAYRRHSEGLWWGSQASIWQRHSYAHTKLFIELEKLYKDAASIQTIRNNASNAICSIVYHNEKISTDIIKTFPEYIQLGFKKFKDLSHENGKQIDHLKQNELKLQQDLHYQKNETIQLGNEILEIKNSKMYLYMQKIRSLKHQITRH